MQAKATKHPDYTSKKEVLAFAKQMCKQLGKDWKPQVVDYQKYYMPRARLGAMTVYFYCGVYTCSFRSDELDFEKLCGTFGQFKDPASAVLDTLHRADDFVAKIAKIVETQRLLNHGRFRRQGNKLIWKG